jgi:hypothetical protein
VSNPELFNFIESLKLQRVNDFYGHTRKCHAFVNAENMDFYFMQDEIGNFKLELIAKKLFERCCLFSNNFSSCFPPLFNFFSQTVRLTLAMS